ncbi:SDR family NAD(P)-dependent oxidoreductase [Opitutus sp. ER46]|uniref:SDR family oxidoreductase n=1 Tax=Opitutus sp. ER46 TaxID=2161864 RepID=UPI000D303B69|nr:SDR family NAD(P)-dependent oxidoreductase [Opitutus sp. ER46]PTX94596.1 3-oxoacyl-[acyl-carrier-protein] reductase [Opitutus sp. ER46]
MTTEAKAMAGRVALVTGAGSGIGRATAELFALAGARVGVVELHPDDAAATAEAIHTAGGEALALPADVSQADTLDRAIRQIDDTWGRLDFVIANAGINGTWAPIEELSEQEWEKTFAVNLKGTFLTTKLCVPLLRRQGGAIAIVSSVNGTRIFSNAGASAYATTKAGQLAFGRMMALELAKHRIRVNTVCPGAIETNISERTTRRNLKSAREPVIYPAGEIPLTDGKPGTALQVAQVLWFLCSPLASHVTGAEVFVDGAESLLQG